MALTEKPVFHPDFDDDGGDVTLVACDGMRFRVHSTQLKRASGWFRSLFAIPQPERRAASDRTLAMSEDSLIVEILLDISFALPPNVARLESLSDLERALLAAEKYEMPAALEILAQTVRFRAEGQDPWHLYAVAKHFGFGDLET
ncbi:hypothetical protein EXIGLDRAFT_764235 [Exidia glandulosa HHB12029]|uniref:BTB domain-containing protein n=1 Tax=Exidia glandulosa HHB12029 TaxID=1314781 RepID=A0A165L9X0_EXIGL|nr:hypothetical protein EXIGLDRAFT_764235 [Exidia glandulosa HHB12029]